MVHNKWVAKVKTTCRNKIIDSMLPDFFLFTKVSGNMLSVDPDSRTVDALCVGRHIERGASLQESEILPVTLYRSDQLHHQLLYLSILSWGVLRHLHVSTHVLRAAHRLPQIPYQLLVTGQALNGLQDCHVVSTKILCLSRADGLGDAMGDVFFVKGQRVWADITTFTCINVAPAEFYTDQPEICLFVERAIEKWGDSWVAWELPEGACLTDHIDVSYHITKRVRDSPLPGRMIEIRVPSKGIRSFDADG